MARLCDVVRQGRRVGNGVFMVLRGFLVARRCNCGLRERGGLERRRRRGLEEIVRQERFVPLLATVVNGIGVIRHGGKAMRRRQEGEKEEEKERKRRRSEKGG